MDSFELNKMIGAFLGAVFVLFSVGIVSDAIFHAEAPEQEGYAIAAAEPEEGGEAGGAEEAGPEPIAPLMASADPAAGEAAFRRCAACHTAEQGGANKIGPNLWEIVNRPVASHEGFSYSAAMQEFAQGGSVVWDYEHLSHFLLSPKGLVKGTAMNFPGIKDGQDRANVIAYLRSLSANPAPLPDPAAAPAAAEGEDGGAAPAEGAAPAGGTAPAEGGEQPAAGDGGSQGEAQPAPAAPQEQGTAPAPADSAAPTPDAGAATGSEPAQEAGPAEGEADQGTAPEQPAAGEEPRQQ